MVLILARASFAALAAGLLALTGHAVADRQAVRWRSNWYMCARWSDLSEVLGSAGVVFVIASVVLLGVAALG